VSIVKVPLGQVAQNLELMSICAPPLQGTVFLLASFYTKKWRNSLSTDFSINLLIILIIDYSRLIVLIIGYFINRLIVAALLNVRTNVILNCFNITYA